MARKPGAIASIAVRGFKSISDEQQIEIRPLTLLAGANSSGKSSIIQPVLLLKQTLEAPSDPGALLLDGPNVRFTRADQLLSRIGPGQPIDEFAVRLELSDGEKLETAFRRDKELGFDIASMRYSSKQELLSVTPGMAHDGIIRMLPLPWRTIHDHIQEGIKEEYRWAVYRARCFLSFELRSTATGRSPISFEPYGLSPSTGFIPHVQRIIHLPGLRGNPRRTYPRSASGPHFPGTFENYVASVIAQWQASGASELVDLAAALEKMGLTWKVKAEPVDDTQVELRVGRLTHSRRGGAHDLVSIADVGFGVSQSLPVVVALIAAKPGQMVFLEQPEIHLHPRAQRRLAGIISVAAKRGVVVIVETHSALLLREIQTLVATDALDREIVKLHWVQRQQDGRTSLRSADLDDRGAYGAWPLDFDDVELEAEKDYLDAVESKEARR